jgi:putative heme transporter
VAVEYTAPRTGRRLRKAGGYVLGTAFGVLILFLLFGKRTQLVASWHQLGHVSVGWVVAAVVAEAISMWAFAFLQHRVLGLSGTRIALPALFLLTLANDAIANTAPGEPAVSSAYRYRYYRRRGATGASAGWTIFTILVAQAIGMSLLLLAGVLVALSTSTSLAGAGVAILGLVVVAGAGAVLVRRDLVMRAAGALVRGCRRVTGHPRGSIGARIEATLARMREIPLDARSTAGIVGLALAVWSCDFLCLACSFLAVHGSIPWDGVLVAYGAAQVLGSFPIVPGGLGIVEGSLAVILVAYGTSRVIALSAAIVYRVVSFWLAIAIGWVSVGIIAYQARRRRGPVTADATLLSLAGPPDPEGLRRMMRSATSSWACSLPMSAPITAEHATSGAVG